jgi:hypothetical protein
MDSRLPKDHTSYISTLLVLQMYGRLFNNFVLSALAKERDVTTEV